MPSSFPKHEHYHRLPTTAVNHLDRHSLHPQPHHKRTHARTETITHRIYASRTYHIRSQTSHRTRPWSSRTSRCIPLNRSELVIEYRGITVYLSGTKGAVGRSRAAHPRVGHAVTWHGMWGGSCGQLELLPLQYSEKKGGIEFSI